jgi:type IV pilus assembly protein PilC
MPKFAFKARNSLNELIEGNHTSDSEKELVSSLRNEGLVVFSVTEIRGQEIEKQKKKTIRKIGKITAQDIAIFCRQLATLINAGVSILDAVEDISDMVANVRFQKVLKSVAADIREGNMLSVAMKKHQNVFGKIFVALVGAGEKSGKLGSVLQDLALYLENSVKLKRKVTAASVYPLFIGIFFVGVLSGVVLFLIPRFEMMFSSFGAELPLPTRIVMGISKTAVNNFFVVLLMLVGAIIGIPMAYRTPSGRMMIDKFKLNIPIFGEMSTKIIFARFFQTLSTLLRSGIDIVTSLEIASKVINSLPIEQIVDTIKTRIVEGSTLSSEMGKNQVFPKMVVRMTAVGEKSGKLDEMLVKLSDYYTDEVDAAVAVMSSVIEPVLIIFLGVVIGVVVIAMYLPIFRLALVATAG